MQYSGKKVLVVGFGVSGKSAAEFLLNQGAHVIVVDAKKIENHPEVVHEDEITELSNFDFVVMSPGIPQTHRLYTLAREERKPIWGEIELGCRSIKNSIIGITGTNGKTTVTLLVTHILNQNGIKARALGNVGVPLTKELLQLDFNDILVLELSSYQLETLTQPVLDAGVILNVTPDHLDRYENLDAYAAAKFSILRNMKPGKFLYVENNTNRSFGLKYEQEKIRTYGYKQSCFLFSDLNDIYIAGKKAFEVPMQMKDRKNHDLENVMAAYLLCRDMGINGTQFLEALKSFKKPHHRIEFVTEKKGVRYHDDSKGTNIDAVLRAVQSIPGPIILIAGGIDKGSSYKPWLECFTNKVKYICAIGQAANKIKSELTTSIPVEIFPNLDLAVQKASELACEGDNVLLSPGCSSFDMFRDYAHRGEEFQRIVHQL